MRTYYAVEGERNSQIVGPYIGLREATPINVGEEAEGNETHTVFGN